MWGIVPLDNYATDTKYKLFGRPLKLSLLPHPEWRAQLVKAMVIPKNFVRETVYLSDFGLAIKAGTSVSFKEQSPGVYCAPERFHNIDPSFVSDMWSYMCLFAELYLGFTPFSGFQSDSVLTSMVNILGPLPLRWKGHYRNVFGTYDDSWYDQSRKPDPTMLLKAMIKRARPEASEIEQNNLLSVMSKGFCYLPEYRMSAEQLLQDTSFRTIQIMLATTPHELTAPSVADSAFRSCASNQEKEYNYPSIPVSLPDPTLFRLLFRQLFPSNCTLAFCADFTSWSLS